MKLSRLILMPDGTVHEQDRVETNDIDPGLLEAFGTRFTGLRWDSSVQTESGKLRVVWNGSESGIALGTFWLDEQMFLCTVLAAGFEPEHDEYILNLAGSNWDRSDLVQGLTGGKPSKFATLQQIPERPLLAGMLLPTLPVETYSQLKGVDLILAALFLGRVAQWRSADEDE
jgi:hypothetical protein